MARKPEVKLTFAADGKSLEKAFDRAGDGAKDMACDFDRAGDEARRFGKGMDNAAAGAGTAEGGIIGVADVLDGMLVTMGVGNERTVEMLRGMGDLAGGFEQIQGAAKTASGAFGQANTAIKNGRVQFTDLSKKIKTASSATSAHTVRTHAQTVATKAQTLAQRALNLAMRANPILLVVTALAVLGTAFVVAYKKSETFRDIVNGALDAVKGVAESLGTAFTTVLDGIKTAFNGLGTFLEEWGLYLLGPVGAVIAQWDNIKAGAGAVRDGVKAAFNDVVTFMEKIPGRISDVVKSPFKAISGPATGAKDIITGAFNDVITFLGKIPERIGTAFRGAAAALAKPFKDFYNLIPSPVRALLEGRNPFGGGSTKEDVVAAHQAIQRDARSRHSGGIVPGPRGVPTSILALGGERVLSPGQSGGGGVVINVHALDARGAGEAVAEALRDYTRRNGPIPGIAT